MLKPDLKQVEQFLSFIGAVTESEKFSFQTFDDSNQGRKHLARQFHGSWLELRGRLLALNQEGAGVFVVINETDLQGRKTENVVAIRGFFADKDNGAITDFPIRPSMVVSSVNGDHAYFLLKTPLSPSADLFRKMQKRIAEKFDSDPKVSDLPRVMRIPGLFHAKDPQDPRLVILRDTSDARYSIEEIIGAFQGAENFEGVSKWASGRPGSVGVRNFETLKIVREGLGAGLSRPEVENLASEYCARTGLDWKEANGLIDRQVRQHEKAPFKQIFTKGKESYADIAERFVFEAGYIQEATPLLRSYRGEFYKFNGCSYKILEKRDLFSEILRFFQQDSALRSRAVTRSANEVLKNIEALFCVGSEKDVPFFLGEDANEASNFVSVKNGLIDLSDLARGSELRLQGHTPRLFNLSVLPYSFDSNARCTTWLKFLKTVMPEADTRAVLQEWFGLCLTYNTSFQKFLMLYGEGANGKSVICAVLRALLGKENVSSVPMEALDPGRTFPLSTTFGKLANIVEEVGSFQRTQEGLLKQIVSGGSIQVEKKHRDGFPMTPTVRMTFASNLRPTFQDKSEGIWRRLLGIPMKIRIPVDGQDRNLVSIDWWEKSGELSGIFNWAVEGLARLQGRGYFIESTEMLDAKLDVRQESNSALEYLRLSCQMSNVGDLTSSRDLYMDYSIWCSTHGIRAPLDHRAFNMEVKRAFLGVLLTEHPKTFPGGRSRAWQGLSFVPVGSEI